MSYLDSLESNLKNLEARTETASGTARDRRRRETDRARMLAESGNAEKLRAAPFATELLKHLTRMGHATRTKVRMIWIGTTLRFEARERRLELRPTVDGFVAVFVDNAEEKRRRPLSLEGNPEELAREWLG
jgi:hypothetical protein